jgi:hypothetical protein
MFSFGFKIEAVKARGSAEPLLWRIAKAIAMAENREHYERSYRFATLRACNRAHSNFNPDCT